MIPDQTYVSTDEIVKESKNPKYWCGSHNKIIRYYKYAQHGLATLNEFRYLAMGCFALYFTFKLDNPVWLPVMFLLSLPVLIALGWWYVHKAAKVLEYINIRFSTVWGIYNYKLLEDQLKTLQEVRDAIVNLIRVVHFDRDNCVQTGIDAGSNGGAGKLHDGTR